MIPEHYKNNKETKAFFEKIKADFSLGIIIEIDEYGIDEKK